MKISVEEKMKEAEQMSLKYADTFRLYQKYVVPLIPYADDYYIRNIKPNTKKGLNAA